MISTENIVIDHKSIGFDLARHDHVWVIRGFKKEAFSSLESATVTEIIGRYLPIEQMRITREQNGKPVILTMGSRTIHISLSHSHNLLLLAISSDAEIGVDLELIAERKFMWQIAARYFDEHPKCVFDFYREWTAREAFVKAIGGGVFKNFSGIRTEKNGCGLNIGFDERGASGTSSSSSGLTRGSAQQPPKDDDKIRIQDRYSVTFFYPDENYAAAICRKRVDKELLFFDQNGEGKGGFRATMSTEHALCP